MSVWLPDTDTLLRLLLLAVALYVVVVYLPAALLVAVAVATVVAPLLGAVFLFRWLAGLLGTPGAILTLAAGGLALGLVAYAARGWRR